MRTSFLFFFFAVLSIGCSSGETTGSAEGAQEGSKDIMAVEESAYEESPKCHNFSYGSRKEDFSKFDFSLLTPEEEAMLGIYLSQYVFVNKAVEQGKMSKEGLQNAASQGFQNLGNVCDVIVHMKDQAMSRNLTGKDMRNRWKLMDKSFDAILE